DGLGRAAREPRLSPTGGRTGPTACHLCPVKDAPPGRHVRAAFFDAPAIRGSAWTVPRTNIIVRKGQRGILSSSLPPGGVLPGTEEVSHESTGLRAGDRRFQRNRQMLCPRSGRPPA